GGGFQLREVDVLDLALPVYLARGLRRDDAEPALHARQCRLDLEIAGGAVLIGEHLAHLRRREDVAEDHRVEGGGGHAKTPFGSLRYYRFYRLRESGDPYAVSLRLGADGEMSEDRLLWVPAFAGTTTESQCLPRNLPAPLAHGGQHHDNEDQNGGDDEGETDRLTHEHGRVAPGHQHRAAEILLHHRTEHEAEQHGGERKAKPHAEEAGNAERRGGISAEGGNVH